MSSGRLARGFTLVELVVAIVIFGIIGASIAVFFVPAVNAWLVTRTRAELSEQADSALRRMVADVRVAVPNSIRTPSTNCVELVPTSGGGRLRMAADTVNAGSAALDTSTATSSFDVLSPLASLPTVGDFVVIDNQNPNDVYSGSNRAAISAVSTPAATLGKHRIAVAATQFPLGYSGGRFVLVAAAQAAVFYVCAGADGSTDAAGDGKGTVYRLMNYGFNASPPAACPSTAGGAVLATRVKSCRFIYDPNKGATQQNGFVSVQLELARNGEIASLVLGGHVSNVP